jgi:hypothetical protein
LDNVGGWTYWYGPWYSGLKLHEAGNLDAGNGTLSVRGSIGHYWSSNQGDSFGGWVWDFSASYSGTGYADKNYGYSLRCVKDECIIPQIPLQGIHIPSQNQVIWNWSSVNAAVGYKWNTTNDYTTATEMGTDTTKTETGLTSNTFYTRYVWAYNECGVSNVSILTNQTTEFIIGQNFGGGIIFYIDSTGQHGLIAAPSDQSYGAQWGCYGTILWNSSTAIGTGQTNTTAIVNGCSEQGIPARICNDLVLNGYSDWFLPSKEELDLMYSQRIVIGGFMSIYYWSSSEYSSIQAWGSNFYDGIQYPFSKDNGSILVRAVRAF